ncbi:hypothetical protein AAFF_G00275430 [Aldrovandia affinis]|uniref:Uncharacterized protein n=1 Tax=Aldrovandia affinis TaxID=143900 RepID=A0AAD7SS79_9TELE|nr:hypothetical protein AAFF_G00275430 [Aldrovandia affinis]
MRMDSWAKTTSNSPLRPPLLCPLQLGYPQCNSSAVLWASAVARKCPGASEPCQGLSVDLRGQEKALLSLLQGKGRTDTFQSNTEERIEEGGGKNQACRCLGNPASGPALCTHTDISNMSPRVFERCASICIPFVLKGGSRRRSSSERPADARLTSQPPAMPHVHINLASRKGERLRDSALGL